MTPSEIHNRVYPFYLSLEKFAQDNDFGMDMADDSGRSIWLMVQTRKVKSSLGKINTFLSFVELIHKDSDWEVSEVKTDLDSITAVFTLIEK